MSSFFGELYLRTTRPFLGSEVSDVESEYLAHVFALHAPDGPVVDLGCGHGRHAARLQGRIPGRLPGQMPGGHAVIGIDLDALSLAERERDFPAVRGDLRSLPFQDASLGGAFAWYSTLFVFDDPVQKEILAEVARCLKPGSLLVCQTSPLERLEKQPASTFDGPLPDGSMLHEQNRFDPDTQRDMGTRQLTMPDGRVLSAQYFIRYYRVPELAQLLESAGFSVRFVHGGLGGEPVTADSADLIVGAERNG